MLGVCSKAPGIYSGGGGGEDQKLASEDIEEACFTTDFI